VELKSGLVELLGSIQTTAGQIMIAEVAGTVSRQQPDRGTNRLGANGGLALVLSQQVTRYPS
jgi:hypothetical protein